MKARGKKSPIGQFRVDTKIEDQISEGSFSFKCFSFVYGGAQVSPTPVFVICLADKIYLFGKQQAFRTNQQRDKKTRTLPVLNFKDAAATHVFMLTTFSVTLPARLWMVLFCCLPEFFSFLCTMLGIYSILYIQKFQTIANEKYYNYYNFKTKIVCIITN
jgi:hypothetical protein